MQLYIISRYDGGATSKKLEVGKIMLGPERILRNREMKTRHGKEDETSQLLSPDTESTHLRVAIAEKMGLDCPERKRAAGGYRSRGQCRGVSDRCCKSDGSLPTR